MPDEKKVSFKATLNLPQTDFSIRSNPKQDDPEMIKRWEKEALFKKTFYHNMGKESFILHDGPPYANGNIHIGHAYNKILKDITCKSQRMMGKHVPVMSGWDCHGLPIELKVSTQNPGLSRIELKKKCREYAQKWITIQRDEFKQLGVLMNWDTPYLTMDFSYEAEILRSFGTFVEKGYIEHKNKTVPWCASCQTVLASAEIEYQDRKDPSIYVLFKLDDKITQKLFPQLAHKSIQLLVWTTTPWTLPLNKAVLLKPDSVYVILQINEQYVVVGKELADTICTALTTEKTIITEFNSNDLFSVEATVEHPFIENLSVPILLDISVSLEDGTACVHCAPGAGSIDYEIGIKNNIDIYAPVDKDGKYTNEINPKELAGMSVSDGQIWVIKKLSDLNKLLLKKSINHSYPHCWRCRNGLIFRATKQWFCDLSKNKLQERSFNIIDSIQMFPESSKNRFKATVQGRLEWCLSRQRVWGIPIVAFICNSCENTHIDKTIIDSVAQEVEKKGIEYWDTVTIDTILPKNTTCTTCLGTNFRKEEDILDVWFESGVSHQAVLVKNKDLLFPADMYLEGKDQHRAWFQSSLLTSMVLNDTAPMKNIITHGFTVDAKGKKMSKSLGNTVSPEEMIATLGTDGVRLWASSLDYAGEAIVSDNLLKNVQEVFRKVRNTCRFLLSNIYDFNYEKDAIALQDMTIIDQYALQVVSKFHKTCIDGYKSYDFTAVFHELGDYCSAELSSFYLDIIKDRLYVERADGQLRRSTQTACFIILDTITKLMAPILSFTAEQVSDHYQKNKKDSIHLQTFPDKIEKVEQKIDWELLKEFRSSILKAIEEKREKQEIKHSLEAHVIVYINVQSEYGKKITGVLKLIEYMGGDILYFLKEFVIVSQFTRVDNNLNIPLSTLDGIYITVEKAAGKKCPRCWNYDSTNHIDFLCNRCQNILTI